MTWNDTDGTPPDMPRIRWPRPTRRRPVAMFDTYDEAKRDAALRGACIVLDAHWRFWSTPTELTLHDVHSAMFATLAEQAGERPAAVVIRTPPAFGRPPS